VDTAHWRGTTRTPFTPTAGTLSNPTRANPPSFYPSGCAHPSGPRPSNSTHSGTHSGTRVGARVGVRVGARVGVRVGARVGVRVGARVGVRVVAAAEKI
jgi:hypothetical protein